MRPIHRSAANATGWSRPDHLDFSSSTQAAVIQRVFATPIPATDDCLALWDDDISGTRSLSADECSALGAIRDRVTTEYKKAASHLLDDVGSFCAYCELPLHDPSQLEHVLPKSQFPTFALDWDNFVPACIACNSRKSKTPLRSDVATWLSPTPCTPANCHQEIRSKRYRWPDLDAVDGHFAVGLYYQDPGAGWTQCRNSDAVDSGTRQSSTKSIVTGEIRASLPTLGLADVAVAAWVSAADADPRTKATIDLCVLDRRPQPLDAADRRTQYRTEAWLLAVKHLRPLYDSGLPAMLPESIGDLIASTGFYWAWLTVARSIDANLAQIVIDGTNGLLPGTDPARLP